MTDRLELCGTCCLVGLAAACAGIGAELIAKSRGATDASETGSLLVRACCVVLDCGGLSLTSAPPPRDQNHQDEPADADEACKGGVLADGSAAAGCCSSGAGGARAFS